MVLSYYFTKIRTVLFVLFDCLKNKPCWGLSVGIQPKVKMHTLLQSIGYR